MDNKNINFLPLPFINMFDLDVVYQTSDVELLYQLIEKVNQMIKNLNEINNDIVNVVNSIINQALQDGSIFLDTNYNEDTKTLEFLFKKVG